MKDLDYMKSVEERLARDDAKQRRLRVKTMNEKTGLFVAVKPNQPAK